MRFNYTAYGLKGDRKHGTAECRSYEELRKKLKKEKLILIDAKIVKESRKRNIIRKINKKDILSMTREMMIMLESGIDIINAISLEEDELPNKDLKRVMGEIKSNIMNGSAIWEAFKKYVDIFGEFYIDLLRIGEISGTLVENMQRICDQIGAEEKLKRKIREAVFYPGLIMTFSMIVIVFLVGYVLPGFAEMFEESDVELPTLTKDLLFISKNIWIILGTMVILGVGTVCVKKKLLKNYDKRYIYDSKILKLPIIGKIMTDNIISKVSKNITLMMNAGVNILDILDNIAENMQNVFVKKGLVEMRGRILTGEDIGNALETVGVYRKNHIKMIKIGENAGRITDMFDRVSDMAYDEMQRCIKKMLILLEPILMLILGSVIGIVVIAIYLPIFGMNDLVR